MMSRIYLENDYWQNNLVKATFLLKKNLVEIVFCVNVQHQFDADSWSQFDVDSHKGFKFLPMVDGLLTSMVGIILMLIQCFKLYSLNYCFALAFELIRSNACPKILNKDRIVVYCTSKHVKHIYF